MLIWGAGEIRGASLAQIPLPLAWKGGIRGLKQAGDGGGDRGGRGKGTKDWHWREWAVNQCSRDLKTELRDRGREKY